MIYYKKQQLVSIDEIYRRFNKSEFKSPYRSTIPLLALFKNNQLPNIKIVDINQSEDISCIFEYETPIISGRGRASSTDLIISYSNYCIAIEAKRTEPPYETVGKWLGRINTSNRKQILEGWLKIIEEYTGVKVLFEETVDLPYQLIHRVASACSLNKEHTELIYIGFSLNDKKINYYLDSLRKISTILENKLDLYLYCYNIFKSKEQISLEERWDNGERDLSEGVIDGLINNNLMTFSEEMSIKINMIE